MIKVVAEAYAEQLDLHILVLCSFVQCLLLNGYGFNLDQCVYTSVECS